MKTKLLDLLYRKLELLTRKETKEQSTRTNREFI